MCRLSFRCSYGRVWETQVSVLSGDGLCLAPRPVGKKCSSQSKGFLVDISLYGQGVVEGLILSFQVTRSQSAAVIVWVHTSPGYVGGRCPPLRKVTSLELLKIKCGSSKQVSCGERHMCEKNK
jgi:hypothetical protein